MLKRLSSKNNPIVIDLSYKSVILRMSEESIQISDKKEIDNMKLNPIASNITEVEIGDKTILFSYKTPVAYHEAGIGYAKTNKYWSVTTSRHINKWLKLNRYDASRGDGLREVDQENLDKLVA